MNSHFLCFDSFFGGHIDTETPNFALNFDSQFSARTEPFYSFNPFLSNLFRKALLDITSKSKLIYKLTGHYK
jgi:hypothetical protein